MAIIIDKIKIKRGNKTNVDAAVLDRGELAAAVDTREVFVGDGTGKVKLSDVVFSATHASLPGTGEVNKVYFVISDETNGNEPAAYIFKASNYVLVAGGSSTIVPGDITGFDTQVTDIINALAGANDGLATLDSAGKIPSAQLPDLALTDVHVVADNTERDALTPQQGDYAVVTGVGETYIWTGSAWQEIVTTGGVTSVNGQTGPAILLDTDNIAEGSAQYFTTQRAIDAVINDAAPTSTSTTFSASYITTAIAAERTYLGTKQIDEAGIADSRVVTYNSTGDKLEYHLITVDGGEL